MPNTSEGAIRLRQFGRHKVKTSAVGVGGIISAMQLTSPPLNAS